MDEQRYAAKIEYYEIACQQVLAEDSSVFSIQSVVIPASDSYNLTPEQLLDRYLAYIRFFTLSLVRPVIGEQGIDFRLVLSPFSLIKFSPPAPGDTLHGKRLTLRIAGGILVQPKQCERGELDFMVETVTGGTKLTLQLADYCPLLLGNQQPSIWRKWLYRLTQAYIHKVVIVRFLARVYREITGCTPQIKVVKVCLRPGEDI